MAGTTTSPAGAALLRKALLPLNACADAGTSGGCVCCWPPGCLPLAAHSSAGSLRARTAASAPASLITAHTTHHTHTRYRPSPAARVLAAPGAPCKQQISCGPVSVSTACQRAPGPSRTHPGAPTAADSIPQPRQRPAGGGNKPKQSFCWLRRGCCDRYGITEHAATHLRLRTDRSTCKPAAAQLQQPPDSPGGHGQRWPAAACRRSRRSTLHCCAKRVASRGQTMQ